MLLLNIHHRKYSLYFRVGDVLLSINDESVIGWSEDKAKACLKALPRGPFNLKVMVPPKPFRSKTLRDQHPPSQLSSEGKTTMKWEGVIETTLQRYPNSNSSFGFEIEGGVDTYLQFICIKSLVLNSAAFNCGLFKTGDQLVMVGEVCLIGMTLDKAKHVLDVAPLTIEVVAQRKSSPKQDVNCYVLCAKTSSSNQMSESSVTEVQSEQVLPKSASGFSVVNLHSSSPNENSELFSVELQSGHSWSELAPGFSVQDLQSGVASPKQIPRSLVMHLHSGSSSEFSSGSSQTKNSSVADFTSLGKLFSSQTSNEMPVSNSSIGNISRHTVKGKEDSEFTMTVELVQNQDDKFGSHILVFSYNHNLTQAHVSKVTKHSTLHS